MKLLIISDVHSNYEALKELDKIEQYDEVIFLGDAINYGPQPVDTLQWIKDNVKHRIMGNHDNAVLYGADPKCSPKTLDIALYTMENITNKLLDKSSKDILNTFKIKTDIELDGVRCLMMHGSPYDNLFEYTYGKEMERIAEDPNLKRFSWIMSGHTHFPALYKARIINPGSCGMPRDGNPAPSYVIMDLDRDTLEFHRFKYENEKVKKLLKELVKDNVILEKLLSYYG